MTYEHLQLESRGSVQWIWLNRPNVLNALSRELLRELVAACGDIQRQPAVEVVVLAGHGKHFSAGADLNEPPAPALERNNETARLREILPGSDAVHALRGLEAVSIAAIHGYCLGGAACLASACDFRLCSEGTQVGYPESQLGMNLSWGGLALCLQLVGPTRAKEMVALGRNHPAAQLLSWGFVDEVLAADLLYDRATELAEAYAQMPTLAVQMIKRSVNALADNSQAAIMHMERDQSLLAGLSEGQAEALRAFRARKND